MRHMNHSSHILFNLVHHSELVQFMVFARPSMLMIRPGNSEIEKLKSKILGISTE